MDKFNSVDDYIASFPEKERIILMQMRSVIRAAAPEAEESISYGMPAYKLNGPLVYFGGFKNHVSLFATASRLVKEKFEKELQGYVQSKGTIQFQLNKPIPLELIEKIVRARVAENQSDKN